MIERSTVGSLLRSTQAFCSQLCDKETLDFGIAYTCPRYPTLPEANQFREVVVADPADVPRAFEQAQRHFETRQLACRRWAPADRTALTALAEFLHARNFVAREYRALAAARWVDPRPMTPDVRVLPARAMRNALEATFLNAEQPADAEQRRVLAAATTERMDDPQFEMFVAIAGGAPAGRCALYQVGDIARVMDLCVLRTFTNLSVERALLTHVLALAKRLAMRNICALIDAADAEAMDWFAAAGFVDDGTITEFERPA